MVNVSFGPVGGLCVLHTNVAPLGSVPVFVNVVKFAEANGQVFIIVADVIAAAVDPASQVTLQIILLALTASKCTSVVELTGPILSPVTIIEL